MSPRTQSMTAAATTSVPIQKAHRAARLRSLFVAAQPISIARFRENDPRSCRIALDLSPQMRDVHAQVLLRVPVLTPPDRVEDLLVAYGAPAMDHQTSQNVPLGRRQLDL